MPTQKSAHGYFYGFMALFIIAKTWAQLRWPSVSKQINWYIQTMLLSTKKKGGIIYKIDSQWKFAV